MKTEMVIENNLRVVTFLVGDEEYGIYIMKIQEIIRFVESVKVPKAPPYVDGVINLRGKIIPIIDLRKRLGKVITPPTDISRIIVVDSGNRFAGLVVDRVMDVIALNNDQIEPCPIIDETRRSDYIMGVARCGERLITVLNLENLLKLT